MKAEKAGFGDIDALVALRLAFLCEDLGLSGEQAETIERELPGYFRRHLDRDLFAYVVREAQEIVSCALLLVVEKPMSPAFPSGLTGTVLNVYTRPAYRRRGCAGSIMRALTAEAEEKGLALIELKATEDGYALYRSVGFHDEISGYRRMVWEKPN